jgi:hypothetical protein
MPQCKVCSLCVDNAAVTVINIIVSFGERQRRQKQQEMRRPYAEPSAEHDVGVYMSPVVESTPQGALYPNLGCLGITRVPSQGKRLFRARNPFKEIRLSFIRPYSSCRIRPNDYRVGANVDSAE